VAYTRVIELRDYQARRYQRKNQIAAVLAAMDESRFLLASHTESHPEVSVILNAMQVAEIALMRKLRSRPCPTHPSPCP
jgi:hypothetical protein